MTENTIPVVRSSTEPEIPARALAAETELASLVAQFSTYLDASYPADLDPEVRLWRRITKGAEEVGEVQNALRAYLGENPRKPKGPLSDVVKELADQVGSGLGAIEHLVDNDGSSVRIVTERLRSVTTRAGLPLPDRTSPELPTRAWIQDMVNAGWTAADLVERLLGVYPHLVRTDDV